MNRADLSRPITGPVEEFRCKCVDGLDFGFTQRSLFGMYNGLGDSHGLYSYTSHCVHNALHLPREYTSAPRHFLSGTDFADRS